MLYLDQSDISALALRQEDAMAACRSRLQMLAVAGAVRLRVSIAHFIESPKLSFRRVRAIFRFLVELPGTSFARSSPSDIFRAELASERVDLRDRPLAELGIRERLGMAWMVGVAGPYAEAIAYAGNQTKTIMRAFNARQARPTRSPRPPIDMPAHTLSRALRSAIERDLRRPTRRSDIIDDMHLIYAAHSDVSTVDGSVLDATKQARRQLGDRTRWFRSGSVEEVLDYLERLSCSRREPLTSEPLGNGDVLKARI